MKNNYYSENWYQATEKFRSAAPAGSLRWVKSPKTEFDIPYSTIGVGPNKVVINSGIHGLEGYFGSAAQLLFLREFLPKLSSDILWRHTIVLIHAINGWGMQNRMREVADANGGLVDLNRNFGVDFSDPANLPSNPLYEQSHDLLLSTPDPVIKRDAIFNHRHKHLRDGVWDAISWGQYKHPYGLFYGGRAPAAENRMTLRIYDEIMSDPATRSLTSIGLHTGLGRFNAARHSVSCKLLVSHPTVHPVSSRFRVMFKDSPIAIETDNRAQFGPVLLGDLVDCLDARYRHLNDGTTRVFTADLEIGTGQFPVMSPVYKRMDMGDARYDLINYGRINPQTWRNLTESWYPSNPVWRRGALDNARAFWAALIKDMSR